MKSSAAIREVPAAEEAQETHAPLPFEAKARQENPQAPRPEPEAVSAPSPRPPRKFPWRKAIFGAILAAALAGAAWYAHEWYTVGRFVVSTDDAYVKSDTSALGAKVSGYVGTIPVADNSAVKAGDVLLTLDDGDYKLAVDAARAKIESQKATIDVIARQIDGQQAQIDSAQAQYDMASAQAENADLVLQRQQQLGAKSVASQQTVDDAATKAKYSHAAVAQAQAAIAAAKNQLTVLQAQKIGAEASLKELQVGEAQAERNYSFTVIKAPFDGIVANRAVEPGQYVAPGQRLMALVPNINYIEANFKETQIANLKPGQLVDISVDALDGQTIKGVVESISPASGAEFSLLPPENATGNFTKITQRIPVRIRLPAFAMEKLRPGLSVTVSINTHDNTGTVTN